MPCIGGPSIEDERRDAQPFGELSKDEKKILRKHGYM